MNLGNLFIPSLISKTSFCTAQGFRKWLVFLVKSSTCSSFYLNNKWFFSLRGRGQRFDGFRSLKSVGGSSLSHLLYRMAEEMLSNTWACSLSVADDVFCSSWCQGKALRPGWDCTVCGRAVLPWLTGGYPGWAEESQPRDNCSLCCSLLSEGRIRPSSGLKLC